VNIYETTFIVNPHSDDASIERQVTAVTDIIKQAGGKIIRENLMGTRRLAYPINNLTQGYYANFIFEAPATVLPQIERHFKLEDPYVRYLLIRFDGDPRLLDPAFEPIPFADLRHGGRGRDDERDERSERGERPFRGGRRPEGGGRRPERGDFRGRDHDDDRPRRPDFESGGDSATPIRRKSEDDEL
jgi:small subunit ribosomal protein S6